MNKNTFLSELSRRLRGLPKSEYDDAMNYYIEYFIESGVDDLTDVTPMVGTPEEVSKRIMEECADRQFEKVKTEGGVKNSSRAIWFIILGIFAAPIALPIAIVIAAVVFALVITAFAVVVALVVSAFAVALCGIVLLPAVFWANSAGQALLILGLGCIGISVGILFAFVFYKLGELLVKGLIRLFSSFGKKKAKTGGAA